MIASSTIRQLLSAGQLLRNIGCGATGNGDDVVISSLDEWRAFTAKAKAAEFGLNYPDQSGQVPAFTWLADPFGFGSAQQEYRPEVVEIYGVALRGLRDVPASPWLQTGSTDYSGALKLMLRHAIRMALSTDSLPSPELWERVLKSYGGGRWPVGVTSEGKLVII